MVVRWKKLGQGQGGRLRLEPTPRLDACRATLVTIIALCRSDSAQSGPGEYVRNLFRVVFVALVILDRSRTFTPYWGDVATQISFPWKVAMRILRKRKL